jgi:hypothetical protein
MPAMPQRLEPLLHLELFLSYVPRLPHVRRTEFLQLSIASHIDLGGDQ